ncbi:MAG: L-rhamnose mutarotase [Spirochaetaceae bacterium]
MIRYGQLIGLNPEDLERYKKYHQSVWPEVLEKIKDCNITNYSIFNLGDKLFAYFEYIGSNFKKDMEDMSKDEMTQNWWKLMSPMQIPVKEKKEGEWWANMTEVFHQE